MSLRIRDAAAANDSKTNARKWLTKLAAALVVAVAVEAVEALEKTNMTRQYESCSTTWKYHQSLCSTCN